MRQDPDVILVGETRDKETAQVAMEAALTGHMVFTTLHANDTATAISRLCEMGVPPYLIGASVVGVLSQRLMRRVCPNCCIKPWQILLMSFCANIQLNHTFANVTKAKSDTSTSDDKVCKFVVVQDIRDVSGSMKY